MKIFDNLKIGIQIIDNDFKYVYLNKSLLKSINKSLDEHVGKRMEEVYPGIEESELYQKIAFCMEKGEGSSTISKFEFDDGRVTYWELIMDKIPQGVFIISKDITKSKVSEKEMIESNLRLTKEKRQLIEANNNLQKIMRYVSHDLRGPIGNIFSLAEILEMDFEEENKFVRMIKESAEKVLKLTQDVLELNFDQYEDRDNLLVPAHANELINNIVQVMNLSDYRREQLIKSELSDVKLMLDPFSFERIIYNLLINACKFSPKASTIYVTLSVDGLFTIENQIEKNKNNIEINEENDSWGIGLEVVRVLLQSMKTELEIVSDDKKFKVSIQFKKT